MNQRRLPGLLSGTFAHPEAAGLAPARPSCPQCRGSLNRVPRRLGDRLVSLLMPVRRYRCAAIACHWEGTLRDKRFALPPNDSMRQYVRRVDPL